MINNWNFENKENYYPNIVIIHLGDSEILKTYNTGIRNKEYVKYLRIGTNDINYQLKKEGFHENFFSWIKSEKEKTPLKSKKFFGIHENSLKTILENVDVAIVLTDGKNETQMNYLLELNQTFFKKLDILAFNFIFENAIMTKKAIKKIKLVENILQEKTKSQIIKLEEKSIMNSFKSLEVDNLKKFIKKNINKMVDSLISPFLQVVENPYLFRKIKYFVFENKNFSNLVIPSLAISRQKENRLEDSLKKALINPIFKGAFNASNFFLVNLKGIFLNETHKAKAEEKFKKLLNEDQKFIVTYYNDEYGFDRYTQVSIFAFFIEKEKLNSNNPDIVKEFLETEAKLNDVLNSITKEIFVE